MAEMKEEMKEEMKTEDKNLPSMEEMKAAFEGGAEMSEDEDAEMDDAAAEMEKPAEEAMAEEAAEDLSPLIETLGVTEERAKMLFDAAQQLGKTKGKTAQELADMISTDFDVLMQLEMVAARGDGGAMEPPAAGAMPEMAQPEMMMPPEGM